MMLARGRVVGACVAVATVLAGCGTASKGGSSGVTVSGTELTVYTSEPPGNPTAATTDTFNAEQMALTQAGGKVGKYTVKLVPVHDRELSANARAAVEDSTTIAYLGELVPGTSQISTEILNQQGVLSVSPADTAGYLTQSISSLPSIDSFFPGHSTYKQTFARVVGTSGQEARALVAAMQAQHVSSLYVSSDQTYYGRTLAEQVSQAAKAAGLSAAATPAQAGAYFDGASTSSPHARAAAIQAYDQAATASSSAKLFAPSGLDDPGFVSGLRADAQSRLFVSLPGFLPQDLSPAGKTFVRQFSARYGHDPAPQAIFGYEAMAAVLADIRQAGSKATQRQTIVSGFRSLKRTDSAIGPYTISGGDPSIAPFVLAHVRGGQLVPFRSLPAIG